MVDTVALKGVHHCITVGQARGRGDLRVAQGRRRRWSATRRRSRTPRSGKELWQVRNTRQPFQKGFVRGGPMVNLAIRPRAGSPAAGCRGIATTSRPLFVGDTARRYPKPDGKYIFDKLSSVYISGNATRDDAPNHIRVRPARPSRDRRGVALDVPGRGLRDPRRRPVERPVDVIVNYTNCVQCGAITAKGGRLTPPEGGDGPLYTIT